MFGFVDFYRSNADPFQKHEFQQCYFPFQCSTQAVQLCDTASNLFMYRASLQPETELNTDYCNDKLAPLHTARQM